VPYPADGISTNSVDYKIAIKLVGLKTAVYLARLGENVEPDDIEVYELPPLLETGKGHEELPRIAYIFQVHCASFPTLPGEPIFYGDNIRKLVPTIIHPNEILDGAIVNPYHGYTIETYTIQNHPVIKELYHRHGKELCFTGVIITTSQYEEPDRRRSASIAANLSKSVLGADGVIITRVNAGAPEVDVAETAQCCEEMGVKSTLIMWGLPNGDSIEANVVYNLPKADTMVNVGYVHEPISLPSMKKIIGKPVNMSTGTPASGEFKRLLLLIRGAVQQIGDVKRVSVPY